MIAIIENNKIHSVYQDFQADIIFKNYPLANVEYIAGRVEIGGDVPTLSAEYIDTVRKLAYRALVDDMTVDYVTSQDSETLAAIEAKKAEIKARWPK